jgi:hypothetical protein
VAWHHGFPVVTAFAFFCFLLVLFAAGLPLALLVRRHADGRRVLLMPVLGLCGVVLFTCFLASWGMTGRSIARVALVAIAAAVAGAVLLPRLWPRLAVSPYWEPLSLLEFKAAAPALCIGFFTSILVAWPLFLAGCTDYWGFANPDQAFYMTIVDHLEDHAFGQPLGERVHAPSASAAAGDPAAILGLSYLFPMVSVMTGIPSMFLFGVLCAVMVFLAATSTYVLCRVGLNVTSGTAAVAACLVGLSSVCAQTFYHHSLGSLAVAVVCPTGLTLAASYTRRPEFRIAVLLAFLLAGMLFCYFPGFAILGIILGGWFFIPLLKRSLRVRSLLVMGGLAALLTLVYPRQCRALFQTLLKETVSSRLATTEDEILLSIDSILTEEFVPSIWGLKTLGLPFPDFLVSRRRVGMVLFSFGALFLATTLSGFWKPGGLPGEFKAMLGVVAAITTLYFAKNNGYGVYKLITWLSPLIIVALSVSCMSLYTRSAGLFQKLLLLVLFSYAGLNLIQTVRLARYSRGTESEGLQNASDVALREMHALETGAGLVRPQAVFAAVPDPVLQRWADPFLRDPHVHYLPVITLDMQDSDNKYAAEYRRAAVAQLAGGYLLYMTAALKDIVLAPDAHSSIWHSRVFALAPLDQVQNQLLVGAGWYRREAVPGISRQPQEFRWLRKRAELLLLNPAPTPQRLCLRVLAGYGNPSPTRHLILFVDGQRFDEITISGQARILSKPFTVSGRAGQLEIMVQEDATPIPRTYGLWNRWVPRDPRRLNLAVFEASLEAPATHSDALQARVDFTSEAELARTYYNGVYPDRWLAGRAAVEMRVPRRSKTLRVRGMAPGGTNLMFPMRIRLNVDDQPLGEAILQKPGNFDESVPVPASFTGKGDRDALVSIQPGSNCFVGNGDTRCLTVRLEGLSFEGPGSRYQKLK